MVDYPQLEWNKVIRTFKKSNPMLTLQENIEFDNTELPPLDLEMNLLIVDTDKLFGKLYSLENFTRLESVTVSDFYDVVEQVQADLKKHYQKDDNFHFADYGLAFDGWEFA